MSTTRADLVTHTKPATEFEKKNTHTYELYSSFWMFFEAQNTINHWTNHVQKQTRIERDNAKKREHYMANMMCKSICDLFGNDRWDDIRDEN